MKKQINFHPVTPHRWNDLVKLFGPRGACGGCWCMVWRLSRADFEKQKGEKNKLAMQAITQSGEVPGIIGYCDDQPIAWCSIAPRERFPALERSRIFKRLDDQPVWSIVCLYIIKDFRNKGISVEAIKAAVDYARSIGARVVEAYPFDPSHRLPDSFVWTGVTSAYLKAGFKVAIQRSKSRPMMRYQVKKTRQRLAK